MSSKCILSVFVLVFILKIEKIINLSNITQNTVFSALYDAKEEVKSMSNELTIWSAAKDVSTAVTTVINTYHSLRTVRKQELATLDIKIKAFTSKTYTREAGEIIRGNILEIADTQRFIVQQNLSGIALEMAIDQLRDLNTLLKANLDHFRR